MLKYKSSNKAVSIVGIGGIFPQAPTLTDFWNIITSASCTASIPPENRWRLPVDDVYDPDEGKVDCVYSKRACFIENFKLDLPFDKLHLDQQLAHRLDPLFQLLLQAGCQAFDDGCVTSLNLNRVGVIIGNLALPSETASQLAEEYVGRTFTEQIDGVDIQQLTTEPLNRYMTGLPAAVLAKALGLGGSCYTLDAACASSLYAIKLAVDELQSGRADAMLTGGVARPDSQYTQMGFSQLHALSPTGVCAPFDQNGNGLVVGEGCGMFLLKRTVDAVRDGDHIYAQIAGIGVSNDIGGSLLAPMSDGQLRAMNAAYKQAGWQPHDVDHIECHATGTPVGDAVEFDSLKTLWDKAPNNSKCVLGSVKSNIGHLLTAAGSAAVIKTLLALKKQTLPPTAAFKNASPQLAMNDSPFSVLSEPQRWNSTADRPRRAAVSAFGFGGINAHLLLEEWLGEFSQNAELSGSNSAKPIATEPIAIIGMDLQLGPWKSLTQFRQQALGDLPLPECTTPTNWYGAQSTTWFKQDYETIDFKGRYLDAVSMTPGQFRIPPTELQEMLPRQALMLKSAATALEHAGLLQADNSKAGVFIGNGLDLNATNFSLRWGLHKQVQKIAQQYPDMDAQQLEHWQQQLQDAVSTPLTANRTMGALGSVVASRIAREFKIGGQSFTIAGEENSGMQALQVAVAALQRGEISHAVVGAVDMPGDIRAQISRYKLGHTDAIAEGACTIILKTVSQAQQDNDTIFAIIDATASNCSTVQGGDLTATASPALQRSIEQLCTAENITPETINYIDICANDKHLSEQKQLFHQHCGAECAISNSSSTFGHSGEIGGLIGVVQAALALHHCILPATSSATQQYGNRYWLHNKQQGPRRAIVSCSGTGGTCNQVLLRQWQTDAISLPQRRVAATDSTSLFYIHGQDSTSLLSGLQLLQQFIQQHQASPLYPFSQVAALWYQQSTTSSLASATLAISFVSNNYAELQQQIEFAAQHLRDNPEQRLDGKGGVTLPPCARDKIFYAPQPLGSNDNAEIAFVFPGSGNHFSGMGRELGVQWPAIFEQQQQNNSRLKDQYQPQTFWGDLPLQQIENDHNAMIIAHVALCTAMSDTVRQFAIKPQAAIGYSLGESSSLFSLKVWNDRDAMLSRIEESTLFTSDLAGSCDAARQLWQLNDEQSVDWCLGIIPLSAELVRETVDQYPQAYLLIVNTPQECIIGGNKAAVQQVVAILNCPFIELHGVTTVHCPVPTVVADAYRKLHLFATSAPDAIRFYSCASGQVYPVATDNCADAILAQATDTIDFTKVINQAYADGVRLFIETGSGNSCSRMITQILGDRPHLVRPTCVDKQPPTLTLSRLLGQMIAEGFSCDAGELYVQVEQSDSKKSAHKVTAISLRNGLPSFSIPAPPQPPINSFEVCQPPQHDDLATTTTQSIAQPVTQNITPENNALENPLMQSLYDTQQYQNDAHGQFLQISDDIQQLMQRNLQLQQQLLAQLHGQGNIPQPSIATTVPPVATAAAEVTITKEITPSESSEPVAFDREMCMEFAIGSIAKVLGSQFTNIDSHPTRVRLPDEPLMLVDRIISVEGEPCSMSHGRVITEHDVTADRWYLDGGRIPTCVAVEAGQADLFLSGYLGIDNHSKGLAVYRLLDAVVQFHGELPRPGDTIRYDIRIERFFRQGDTWLFKFNYDCTVGGKPLMTMRDGCAGFFTKNELDAGQGIIHTKFDLMEQPGKIPVDWHEFVPMIEESYNAQQVKALRQRDLCACFGESFKQLNFAHPNTQPYTLPTGHMELVDRVTAVIPGGGRFGLGQIRAEMNINPDDWFLTCHFCDDNVMPGTLMYECCLHTLRIYLMRMGWVSAVDEAAWEPVSGVDSQLKCRGQVTEKTSTVTYEVTIKELGYRPEPFAIVDALMYADNKPIVEIIDMSVQISGLTREKLLQRWNQAEQSALSSSPQQLEQPTVKKTAIYDYDSILAYSSGNPSEAFGEAYRIFDNDRRLARLPRPPFQFIDRVTSITATAWQMVAGGTVEAQYDIPQDAWYFAAERHPYMPFSVLLEIALQPCGWMAAYVGSALTSDIDLCFRNLDGNAVQLRSVTPDSGTLTITVKMTRVSSSGGMIIQSYDFDVCDHYGSVYKGDTVFGFFTKQALSNQIGIRDAQLYQLTTGEQRRAITCQYPQQLPYPEAKLQMIDTITAFVADGGPNSLGYIRGTKVVDPDEWFFQAHFYQDPVCPGSLGLESYQQLLKYVAVQRWGATSTTHFEPMTLNQQHNWMYRGQIIPDNDLVTVEAVITKIDDKNKVLWADGFLSVDGKLIYQMKNFGIKILG